MTYKQRKNAELAKELWARVGRWITDWFSSGLDPVRHHEHIVGAICLMYASGKPIVKFESLYRPFLQWILKTPVKPATFGLSLRETLDDPQISQSFVEPLEWILRLFKLATISKTFGATVVDEVIGILLSADSLVTPLLPVILPAVSSELEQKALQLTENVIFKVLPIILNWPTTKQVTDWTSLLILRLRYLITYQQPSKQAYNKQLTDWFYIVETAIDVLCKNLFHRKTRNGAVRLLNILFNSLQRSPKPFLKSLPMLVEAIRCYHEESKTENVMLKKTNPLDIPLDLTAVVSYLKILDLENIPSNLPTLSMIPYAINSKVAHGDAELFETTKALASLLYVQMNCHKGQPEAYIPVYELLQKTICIDSNGKSYDPISASDIENQLKSESWALVNTTSSSTLNTFPTRAGGTSASDVIAIDDETLEFSTIAEFGENSEISQRSEKLKKVGLSGLVNLGNTCYMNSVIQVLYQTVAFKNAIFEAYKNPNDPNISVVPPPNAPALLRELQYTFASLLHTTRSAFAPRTLISTLPDWIKGGRQHDASELEKAVFDILDSYWTKDNQRDSSQTKPSPINQIFGGKTCTSIRCTVCDNISERSESILDLSLTFPSYEMEDMNGLTAAEGEMKKTVIPRSSYTLNDLIENFRKVERMNGSNQYRCDKCNALVDAERVNSIISPPDHLIINLVRFRYDYKTQTRSKILTEVEFKERLQLPVRQIPNSVLPSSNTMNMDLPSVNNSYDATNKMESSTSFAQREDEWKRNFDDFNTVGYTLYGCVMHSGRSTEHGHYYSYARSSEKIRLNGTKNDSSSSSSSSSSTGESEIWYRFNDESVDASSFETFSRITKHFPSDVAYILLFKRDDILDPSGMSPTTTSSAPLIPLPTLKRVDDDNAKAETERRTRSRSHRPTRQALFNTRSRFDDHSPTGGSSGNHFDGGGFGFGGGFGGGWIS
jgi:ubiquitin C-terminal hydrolase